MIASLTGLVESCREDGVILDVNGIGFDVKMGAEGIRRMAAVTEGELAHIYTYMSFGREGDVTLFGFTDREELSLFKKLITVSGIGPKGALSLLSAMSAEDLIFAILSGDSKAIARAPGIGKKTAERLVLDLHDKLELNTQEQAAAAAAGAEEQGDAALQTGAASEAAQALEALGYTRAEAAKAVRQAAAQEGMEDADTQAILAGALRFL